jgi:3',5'-cyclic AMP phosphodiesterase CpdA
MAVKKVLSLNPRPEFVITGGDHVMDANKVGPDRAKLQFDLLAEALKPLEMPVYNTVGNHDAFGWSNMGPGSGKYPGYGKRMFEERVARGPIYRSFDFGGWHFIILDSILHVPPHAWRAEIDDNQLQWLKSDLEKTGRSTPTVISTHCPLVTIYSQYTSGATSGTSDSTIVRNGKEIRDLFKSYNVKAVLQGHTHVVEECIYTGTHYITGGAVCGDWWKGPRLGVHPEGFAVFDVDDDSFRWQYVPYGWNAKT